MKAMDLSGLIKGLLVIIAVALAFGKIEALKAWSIKEATHPSQRLTQILPQ